MKLKLKIKTKTKESMLEELLEMVDSIKTELNSVICEDCTDCQNQNKKCKIGGGSSEEDLESTWALTREAK